MPGKVGKFLKEVRIELKKVTWPNKREISNATWVVITAVVIIAVFIGIVDQILMKGLELILK